MSDTIPNCGIENENEAYVCGVHLRTSSVLAGEHLKQLQFEMKVSSATKSGDIHALIVTPSWDKQSSGSTVLADFGSIDIQSSLTSSYQDITFTTTTTPYEIGSSGDEEIIVLWHDSTTADGHVDIPYNENGDYDGNATCKASKWGNQGWNND